MHDARVRPLIARRGAGFRCVGVGTCCHEMHLLGPLTRSDARRLRVLHPGLVGLDPRTGKPALRVDENLACLALRDGLCALHARGEKPRACRRFPYLLTATIEGGRIGTTHRCPCRSLGGAAEIDMDEAERSLSDRSGRLLANVRAPARVRISAQTSVSFATYRAWEERLIDALGAGVRPVRALGFADGVEPLLRRDRAFLDLARSLRRAEALGHTGAALAWFGHALLEILGEPADAAPPRPFRGLFEAWSRWAAPGRTAEAVFADWIADAIWSLAWIDMPSLDVARAELATRLVVAESLAARFAAEGMAPAPAAAEAVSMADQVGGIEVYRRAAMRFAVQGPKRLDSDA